MYASCCFLLRTIECCPLKLQVCTYPCRWAGWMSGGVYGGVNATVFAKQMANQLHGNLSYHMLIWKTISTSRSFSPVSRPLLLKPLSMVVISIFIFPLLFVLASSSALPNSATHALSSVASAGRGTHRRGDVEIRNAQPKEDASYSPDWAGAVYSSAPVSSC
jgi:hypothetical protein